MDEIVEQAVSEDVRLVTVLRKCLVVANKLKNERLKTWVEHELNGYPMLSELPPYRTAHLTAKGVFFGPLGAEINDQPLPSSVLEEAHRHWATTGEMREPISSYEALIANNVGGSARFNWPADMTAYYQDKFIRGYSLNRAWQEIPIGVVVGIVDTVRNRLLQFALEIQGELGESDTPEAVLTPLLVEKVVQNIIFGGTNFIGNAGGDVQLVAQQVVIQGDYNSLTRVLEAEGIPKEDVAELQNAIEADKYGGAENGYGERVKGWLANAAKYAGKEGVKAAAGAGQKIVEQAILSYLGLGS